MMMHNISMKTVAIYCCQNAVNEAPYSIAGIMNSKKIPFFKLRMSNIHFYFDKYEN